MSKDTKNRVAVLLVHPDNQTLLVGRAPNRKRGPNQWDIVGKGHIASGEDKRTTAVREVWEESGITVHENDLRFIGKAPYTGGEINFYSCNLETEPKELICNSFFEQNGKTYPEFVEYKWIDFESIPEYLYKSLATVLFNVLQKKV